MDATLTIGALAKKTGVSAPTIRFYEAEGIIPQADRTPSGYRLYSPQDVRRLQLAKRARLLGMELPAVKELVQRAFSSECADFADELLEQIQRQQYEVVRRIAELEALRLDLETAAEHVRHARSLAQPGQTVADCAYCPLVDEERR